LTSSTSHGPARATAPPPRRPALDADALRAIAWQAAVIGAFALLVWWLVSNTMENLAARQIASGFGFFGREAGLPIGESPIDYSPADTYARALLIGLLNTLKVSLIGIVLATVLGVVVGVSRLSRNWLLSSAAGVYVEVVRNTPLLLQLFFWYTILQNLPAPRQAVQVGGVAFLSNRGIRLPWVQWTDAYWIVLAALLAGVVATVALNAHARRRQMATGQRIPVLLPGVLLVLLPPLAAFVAVGLPFAPDIPELRGFNFRGGVAVTPEFAALLIGLVAYTAAFIGEIVRAGILAVPRGQWEAAEALGLHRGRALRLIVLPQALRVIIPPTTSQYLNLTKNSSLAVAIGYPDLVSIANTTLNQTGQAIEGIALIMAAYLTVSLSISMFMNWYNRRIALVER
jgi:general L-amino acid transport system permease protein